MEKEVSLDGVDRICVTYDMNNNDIRISEAEGDMLTVKEYNTEELAEDEISTVEVDGSRLEVKGRKETELIMCILGRIMTSIWAIIQKLVCPPPTEESWCF